MATVTPKAILAGYTIVDAQALHSNQHHASAPPQPLQSGQLLDYGGWWSSGVSAMPPKSPDNTVLAASHSNTNMSGTVGSTDYGLVSDGGGGGGVGGRAAPSVDEAAVQAQAQSFIMAMTVIQVGCTLRRCGVCVAGVFATTIWPALLFWEATFFCQHSIYVHPTLVHIHVVKARNSGHISPCAVPDT